MTEPILVEIAPGELLDKISILEIKAERIGDREKNANVRRELGVLLEVRRRAVPDSPEMTALYAKLKAVNEALWEIEDAIRLEEQRKTFGPRFIELARSVYVENDRRAAIKKEINLLLNSRIVEEKSYADYK